MPKEEKKVEEPVSEDDKQANKEMLDLLVSLTESEYWPAIQRYNRRRDAMVMQSLRSIDPFKDTTQMARIQGIGIGLFDLENGVNEEKRRREKAEKEQVDDQSVDTKKKK